MSGAAAVCGVVALIVVVVLGVRIAQEYGPAKERVLARRAVPVMTSVLARDYRNALEPFRQGERAPFAALLLEDQSTTDRLFSLDRLAELVELEHAEAWLADEPDNPAALLLGAAVYLHHALESRGQGTADTVTEHGARGFVEFSVAAEQCLARLVELRPEDPVPWAQRMQAAYALADSLDVFEDFHAEAVARDPDSWTVHRRLLNASCEKWYGSHGAMFAVARKASGDRPESPLSLLVIPAHLERWLYLSAFEDDDAAADAYWDRADVVAEVERAFDAFLPHATETMDGHIARSAAAAWFFTRRDKARTRAAFGDLPLYYERPWAYLGGEKAYRKARLWVEEPD